MRTPGELRGGLTEAEADGTGRAFFAAYPGLRRWHRSVGTDPLDTRTLAGRRRAGVARFTEKLNTPVQGTGADGLKRALGLLWERRGECPGAVPVLVVHDEVVVEAPAEAADAAADWLRRAMVDGMAPLVDPGAGRGRGDGRPDVGGMSGNAIAIASRYSWVTAGGLRVSP